MTDKKDAPEEIKEEEIQAAAEKVEEEVAAKEAEVEEVQGDAEAAPEETPAPAPEGPKKGLMQRRKSFAQSSVPNAHRGYNPKTPVIMLGIIFLMLVASFVLASVAG